MCTIAYEVNIPSHEAGKCPCLEISLHLLSNYYFKDAGQVMRMPNNRVEGKQEGPPKRLEPNWSESP